jgi:hypothetical protein
VISSAAAAGCVNTQLAARMAIAVRIKSDDFIAMPATKEKQLNKANIMHSFYK